MANTSGQGASSQSTSHSSPNNSKHEDQQSASLRISSVTSNQPTEGGNSKGSATLGRLLASFVISFRRIGVLFPIIASVMTLFFFFSYDDLLVHLHDRIWEVNDTHGAGVLILVTGFFSALVIALVYAFFTAPLVTSANKGLHDFVLLESIEKELQPYFGNSEADRIELIDISRLKQDITKLEAFTKARETYLALYNRLYFPKGNQLLLNDGDLQAWKMAHHTEEAVIMFKGIPTIFNEALIDYLAISNSTIDGREELLEKLTQAIKNLSPNAMEYLKDFESDKKLDSMREDIQKLHIVLENKEIIPKHSPSPTEEEQTHDRKNTENSQSDAEALARATISSVKCRLHQLYQDRLAGNLSARNNLILSTVASGLITYGLLFLSIITIQDLKTFIGALASAVVLYVTGVAAGLFGRLYAEANKESAVNDYGLSQARLKAIPLISGLAAIGGVLIINTTTFSPTKDSTFLLNIFTLNASNMLMAITFGFAPNLLIRNLQKGEDRYVSNFESTRKNKM